MKKLSSCIFYTLFVASIFRFPAAAWADDYISENYYFKSYDSLSVVLYERIQNNPEARLYGPKGLVQLNKKLNPHVVDWKLVPPNTLVTLRYPKGPDFQNKELALIQKAPDVDQNKFTDHMQSVFSKFRYKLIVGFNTSKISQERGAIVSETSNRNALPRLGVSFEYSDFDITVMGERYNQIANKSPLGMILDLNYYVQFKSTENISALLHAGYENTPYASVNTVASSPQFLLARNQYYRFGVGFKFYDFKALAAVPTHREIKSGNFLSLSYVIPMKASPYSLLIFMDRFKATQKTESTLTQNRIGLDLIYLF